MGIFHGSATYNSSLMKNFLGQAVTLSRAGGTWTAYEVSSFVTKHHGIYAGDGIAVGRSNDITISGLSNTGYKVTSLANLTTDSGKFIAMPLSNTDTSITFRLVNVGTELVAPGTIYFDALYIRE